MGVRNLPKISIITPSYNQAQFIEQTILSVLSQNYPNLEYIIMDGGSTDGTVDILKKYQSKLTWFSERDKGQSHAINKGLKIATGEVMGYLNSDDLLLPGVLLKVGRIFARRKDCMWVTGKCKLIDEDNCEIRSAITTYKNFWLKNYSYKMLLILNFISQPATFWRKSLIFDKWIGFFDESLEYSMDYDYWLRLGKYFPPNIIDDYLAKYRIHRTSKGGKGFLKQFWTEYEISKRYTSSLLLCLIHLIHVIISIIMYELIKQER